MAGTNRTDLTITAADGYALAATLYDPADTGVGAGAAGPGRPTVILSPATGVRRQFYDRFAAHLAGEGFRALTFDYRGMGGSGPASLRGFAVRLRDWGEKDLAGIIAWAAGSSAGSTLVVGHSLGGQLVGLAPNSRELGGLLAVAAQSGYWGHWPAPRKYLMAALWYGLMPGLTAALGYFPARRLKLGEDLPAGVARDWARWCRSPLYPVADDGAPLRPHFADLTAPVYAYSFEGDPYAPRRAVEALVGLYTNASPLELRHVSPGETGARSLGHFGFFREQGRRHLWAEAVARLRAMSGAESSPTLDHRDQRPI